MLGFKDREVIQGGWSESYYDLHDGMFSLRQNGLVVIHANNIWLKNCKFAVQPAGVRKVRETGQKNIHAFVRGQYMDHDIDFPTNYNYYLERIGYRLAYYNPYTLTSFVDFQTYQPVHEAASVTLINKQVYYK